ncbi:MAG: Co2+/Mg2+ efflux protein ApaG [Bdellovibrionota bacterium]
MLYTYTAITNKILVSATPYLIKEKSRPKDQHFVYAYHIRIKNDGETPIILQRRFWRIRHGKNKQEEILGGEGVVGQYPQINPGEEFEYQSFCPIPSPFGSMRGHFQFIDKSSALTFRADIPLVFLRPDQAFTPDPRPNDHNIIA